MSPRLLIFDDGRGRWGPLADRRAIFDVLSGALTARRRIERRLERPATALVVPPVLAAVYRAREPKVRVNPPLDAGEGQPLLLVNGRWPGATGVESLHALGEAGVGRALVQADGQVVAACLDADQARAFVAGGLTEPPDGVVVETLGQAGPVLIERPWHLLEQLEATLADDLLHLPVRVDPTATVHPTAVFEESRGPVAIAEQAVIGALSVLEGPCWIGPGSIVQPLSYIRPNTVVGRDCKVAGEISSSILHDHTNKAHAGYLGQSLVGEWVNLGANTNVSNLKNTYGSVRVQLQHDLPAEDSGRIFHGPIIGDFVRTAIGTRLLTGSVVGTAAMIARSGFPPKCVAPFTFLTDAGEQAEDFDKFIATARAMFARRHMTLDDAEIEHLRQLRQARG